MGRVVIAECRSLVSFEGLENLKGHLGSLMLFEMPNLVDISTLSGMSSSDTLMLSQVSLPNLNGLQNVNGSLNQFFLNDCIYLQNIEALRHITSIGMLVMSNMPRLSNLYGLHQVA